MPGYGDVHVIGISTAASFVYGADGRGEVAAVVVTEVEDAYMAGGNGREVAQFAQRGITLDAVCLIPLGVEVPTESGEVDTTCTVSCSDDELHPQLRGTYRIVEVHPLLGHVRLMLARTQRR
jgi:hypothetical protein